MSYPKKRRPAGNSDELVEDGTQLEDPADNEELAAADSFKAAARGDSVSRNGSSAEVDASAMVDTVRAICDAETTEDLVSASLNTLREAFDWAYASYWKIDKEHNALVFSHESGSVGDEFRKVTRMPASKKVKA